MQAMVNHRETYICFSRRFTSVPMTTTANMTQRITTTMSMGHSSSEYSFVVFMPAKSERAASAMPALKSHSCTRARPGNARGVRVSFSTM
jgi:hypothetical protein